jgi:hypothetical protein
MTNTNLREWGRIRREIAEVDEAIQECQATLAQFDKWLQTDIGNKAMRRRGYMPEYRGDENYEWVKVQEVRR